MLPTYRKLILICSAVLLCAACALAVTPKGDGISRTRTNVRVAPATVAARANTQRAPVAVDTLGAARARRDAYLFAKWVAAVAARPLPTLPHDCPDDVERIIRDVFAGTGQEDFFVGIAWRESRCQPGARNPNGGQVDSGVMQIRMPLHADLVGGCDIFEPRCNVMAARRMYDICGVGPWDKAGGYWCSPPN